MEFSLISEEIIKPSSSLPIHHSEPFKLSFLDQLTPTTYVPAIFFYADHHNNIKQSQVLTELKNSLSETLSIFYPFSGRTKDNLFVQTYEEGVPFIETQVRCRLLDFLQHLQIELLNQFLPCQPFSCISDPEAKPVIAVQVTFFDCGGFAIGVCISHKFCDGATAESFFNCWADIVRGSSTKKIIPDFSKASLQFRPVESSESYLSMTEQLWFNDECKYVTKRFVFNPNAIDTLKAKAKGEGVDNPSRIKTLSSFIWKSCTAASRSISASSRTSLAINAVNIRQKSEPGLPEYSAGNLFWWAIAACNTADAEMRLQDLVASVNESLAKIDSGYVKMLQSEEARLEILSQHLEFFLEKPDVFAFTSWLSFNYNEVDFGWGKPVWVGLFGEAGPAFRNLTIFNRSMSNNGTEAWITLDKNIMDKLERDPEFLTFAAPNPSILMPSLANN